MVRTRFAPSPTGPPHIGHLRTAAYAYALAKHDHGQFLLRIEDTDQKRLVPQAVQKNKDFLITFGLKWDKEYVQSQRLSLYKQAAEKLVASGHAYEDAGAIRIRIPERQTVSYHDFALDKDISWQTDELKDLVLFKSDGFPTYHLAAVVDDHEMQITHVLRGHDWIPSTPIHLLLYKFLGYQVPEIGHLTDILSPEGGKLSKRKGSTSIDELLKLGYLPEALLNFVILLGWAPKDNRELFTLDEFVAAFDVNGFQKSNPALNLQKLDWFNRHYIRQKSDNELLQLITPYFDHPKLVEIIPLLKERLVKLTEFPQLAQCFVSSPPIPPDPSISSDHLRFALDNYDRLVKGELIDEIKSKGWKIGDFFMSLRVAICGSHSTPPITETMLILGKDESVNRIKTVLHEY
ncbi:glutamate--tRNA ligase [Candidatus Amesbacteria bacterium]|nr:glutamate--tRNA ligase [Candidatus Amesbacteria bacterium]MBI2587289.1 glutamate--tRNA ligase [Candidatus Amesbacteria bacterium]